jgi:hypothetical protein
MRKHITKLLTALLAIVMLLPVTAQAAPTDGWTDEAEQAYQTVTELVVQRVSESKDYLAAATQEENTKAVYALWTSGAAVPSGFYDEYLQALADWLDLAVKRGKTAYIPGVIRTVAAMGLDVTDFAGHDLMDALRKPELVEADEDRLDMLMDLDAVGDAGKTDEFNALRETLLTETLARQQSSGEFRYTSKWPAELKQKGVDDEPDRFDYILLTAKSVQALAPYMSRKNVATAIDKALNYLSEQQLSSGGFVKYGDEDVEEDAAVLEMLATLGISLTDERFTKDGHTVLDGMMGWYQAVYSNQAPKPGQGFYREEAHWGYSDGTYTPVGWGISSWSTMNDPDAPNDTDSSVIRRDYLNGTAFPGIAAIRVMAKEASINHGSVTSPVGGDTSTKLNYKQLLKQETKGLASRIIDEFEDVLTTSREISDSEISTFSAQLLALQNANIELTKAETEKLQEIMTAMVGASSEYYLGRTSSTYSAGAVRATQYLGMNPGDINGLDYLAVLTNTDKLAATSTYDFNSFMEDIAAVDPVVWRSRGVDVDTVVDKYAARILADQTPDGGFDNYYGVNIAQGHADTSWRDDARYTAETLTALAPYADKEYVAKAIDAGLEYLSSVQLADGSFANMSKETPDGEVTLAVLKMMEALDISLDDERFVKNGNTVADAMRTFYVDGVGFISNFDVEAPLDNLDMLPSYDNPNMGISDIISALTYLQAAENGKFGPDGTGNSVFEIVGSALTETPLGAILLAVIIVALLAFGMIRRYRRIKKEQ